MIQGTVGFKPLFLEFGKKAFSVIVIASIVMIGFTMIFGRSASAQYDHTIDDPQNDVMYRSGSDILYDVERPNIDITQIKMTKSGDNLTVSMTVKGTIADSENLDYLWYIFDDKDDEDDDNDAAYMIRYNNGDCMITGGEPDSSYQIEENLEHFGAGTNTLSTWFSLSVVNNSIKLEFSDAVTGETLAEEEYHDHILEEDVTEEITLTESGTTITIEPGRSIKFDHRGEERRVLLIIIYANTVLVTLNSPEQDLKINVSETKRLDTDGDGKEDLSITLNSVNVDEQNANLTLKTIPEDEEPFIIPALEIIGILFIIGLALLVVMMFKGKKK